MRDPVNCKKTKAKEWLHSSDGFLSCLEQHLVEIILRNAAARLNLFSQPVISLEEEEDFIASLEAHWYRVLRDTAVEEGFVLPWTEQVQRMARHAQMEKLQELEDDDPDWVLN